MNQSLAARWGIWGLAFGYFACYVPYSALTKAISTGMLPGMTRAIPGLELLPTTVLASTVGMFLFLTWKGWWKYAAQATVFGVRVPRPTRWTLLSGIATSTVVATTTLAYTFSGVSIVFMMLLMRAGVLVIAPLVDLVSKRRVRWFSWVALGFSLAALLATFSDRDGYELTLIAALDVAAYLAAYFIRLRFMSRLAKSEQGSANVRFFVEEQMVATPVLLLFLATLALIGANETMLTIRAGFSSFAASGVLLPALVVGLLSQGTGIFGGLILLDKRENTFCVPVNRSSSILAGVCASYLLAIWLGGRAPGASELAGAGLILVAILFLTIPDLVAQRRAAAAGAVELHPSPEPGNEERPPPMEGGVRSRDRSSGTVSRRCAPATCRGARRAGCPGSASGSSSPAPPLRACRRGDP